MMILVRGSLLLGITGGSYRWAAVGSYRLGITSFVALLVELASL